MALPITISPSRVVAKILTFYHAEFLKVKYSRSPGPGGQNVNKGAIIVK